jgi:hypothetical protein
VAQVVECLLCNCKAEFKLQSHQKKKKKKAIINKQWIKKKIIESGDVGQW